MSYEAARTGDFSVNRVDVVQIFRRDRTCSRFYTGRDRTRYFCDPEGIDLPDPEAARAEALGVVWDLWDGMVVFENGAVIEIIDETGTVILTLPFVSATGVKKGAPH